MSDDLQRRVLANARRRGIKIRMRAQWGSVHPEVYRQRLRTHPVTVIKADTLVQHITVTFDTGTLTGDFDRDMRTIERIGFERFGSGFSYNFGIDHRDGMVGVGMPLKAKGTHTVDEKDNPGYTHDQNAVARAVAWIGMPGMVPTAAAEESLAQLIAAMMDEKALTQGPDYLPHSFFAFKDCPTDSARAIMERTLARAKEVRK